MTDKPIDQIADELAYNLFQNAAIISRSMLANRLGTQFDGERDLYKTFGYPQAPGYQDYKNLYDRQGIAARLVEKFANDTWNKPPVIIDGDSRSDIPDKQTAFIQEWNTLSHKMRVWNVMRQADIMLGFGRYSVIYMGVPGDNLAEPAKGGPLFFIQAFDEAAATWPGLISDPKSPKYAMPERYTIQFNAVNEGLIMEGGSNVHHTRIIHVTEDSLGSRVYGRPRLQTVLNRLFDLDKVTGGGAEATWLAVYKGVLLSAREGAELPAKDSPEARYLDDQMTSLMHRIQRYALMTDVDVHDLGGEAISIKDNFDTIISDIAGSKGIPQRILLGSERGNQASTQDTQEWNGVIESRRTNFAEPDILRPFVAWCIEHKILTAPESKEFTCEWAPVYGMTQVEEAEYSNKLASGASTITGGVPEEALAVNEWRKMNHLAPMSQPEMDQARERTDPNIPDPNAPDQGPGSGDSNDPNNPNSSKDSKGGSPKDNPFSNSVQSALDKILAVYGNTYEGHPGRPGLVGGSRARGDVGEDTIRTPGAEVSYNIANTEDSYKITAPGGYVQGYIRNADFPGESGKPSRGEVFWIEVQDKRRGLGNSLMLDSLRLMKANGAETVNLSAVSKAAEGMNASLVQRGYIDFIRKSATGKAEYKITDKVFDQTILNSFPGHKGRPGIGVGGSVARDSAGDSVEAYIQEKLIDAENMNKKFPGIADEDWIQSLNGALETYRDYVKKYGEDYPIVLIKDQPDVETRPWYGAMIAASTKEPGEWQATYFDDRGFSGDFTTKTKAEAYWEVYRSGMTRPDPELLDRVVLTDQFTAGVEWSMLPEDEKWKTSIEEVRRKRFGDTLTRALNKLFSNTFEGHRGRVGSIGGSLPRGATAPIPEWKQKANEIVARLGFPVKKFVPLEAEGEPFTVGGRNFVTAGEYTPQTGEIFLYDADGMDETQMKEVLTHEVQHDRYEKFKQRLGEDTDEIAKSIREEDKSKWIIRADGEFRDPADAAKYPAYDIQQRYFEGNKWEQLQRDDGVTDYSRAYWNEVALTGRGTDLAVNETLAEIARLGTIAPVAAFTAVTPAWQELFEKVRTLEELYATIRGG